MPSLSFAICSDCYKKIEAFGQPCRDLCLKSCLAHCQKGFVEVTFEESIKLSPIIRFMEEKRILVSTEISKSKVALVPNTKYLIIEHNPVYCWCAYDE